jgi:flagellar assembly protein FliH
VKIGAEPKTALSSPQEEEQLSNQEQPEDPEQISDKDPASGQERVVQVSNGKAPPGTLRSGALGEDVHRANAHRTNVPGADEPKKTAEAKTEPSAGSDELKKSKERIAALEAQLKAQLNEAKGEKQALLGKVSSLEANIAEVKNTFAQKEQELNASVEAAREQARADGKKQGHAEGLQNGHEAGLAQARTEVQQQYREKFSELAALLEGIAAKLEAHFSELTALNQPRMLRLWQEMLKKMLQREMSLAPDAVLKVLSDAMSRVSDKNHIVIYVSPQDMSLLKERMQGEFGDVLRSVKHLELKTDASVDKGSCLVETNLGVYDARWRTQLEQIDSVVEKLFQQLGKMSQDVRAPHSDSGEPEGQNV